ECFAPTGRGPMKTQGFERRFSQNLAPVGARKAPKPLLCLHFKFIQQTLSKLLVKTMSREQGEKT
ncbi:MAG: hypothetical protein ACK525_02870, partial [Microcystis sp.]